MKRVCIDAENIHKFSLTQTEKLCNYSRMPNNRISKAKQVFILAALSEGTPVNAVCRMVGAGKHAVLRVIAETGEALSAYMSENFRDLPCARVEMDEQWQYVGKHGQRMKTKEEGRGDFWLWCAIDPDTKLVVSFHIGRRTREHGERFVDDVARRVRPGVQVATDAFSQYKFHVRGAFGPDGCHYGTETKVFSDAEVSDRKHGVPQIAKAERNAVLGSPNLATLTTSHIERLFLSVRQELTRFTRCTLAYSKDLRMHKLAVALHFGLYNLVRKHTTLDGQTPAVVAGVEDRRWTLVDVVELTERYMRQKEERAFEAAFAELP
jgi:IS1 family transposase